MLCYIVPTQRPLPGFKRGMKLEAVDRRNPTLVRAATVTDIEGYRVKIHFDGWDEIYDDWFEADSTDIHPVGWGEKTRHPLEPPLSKWCVMCMCCGLTRLACCSFSYSLNTEATRRTTWVGRDRLVSSFGFTRAFSLLLFCMMVFEWKKSETPSFAAERRVQQLLLRPRDADVNFELQTDI